MSENVSQWKSKENFRSDCEATCVAGEDTCQQEEGIIVILFMKFMQLLYITDQILLSESKVNFTTLVL